MMSQRPNKVGMLLTILVVVHTALLVWASWVNSPTIDEIEWLPSGVVHWTTGRMDAATVRNPPHVGLVAAFPLLFVDFDTTAFESQGLVRDLLNEFFLKNGTRTFWLFTLARWACIPFSVVGLVFSFIWARDLYGARAGLLAATLWCFCPNILAHGHLVSHDVPAASFGLVAGYYFWRWLRNSTLGNTVVAGVSLGVALWTKMTLLVYLLIWPVAWWVWRRCQVEGLVTHRQRFVDIAKMAVILFLAVDVLNLGYAFQGTFDRLGSFQFRSHALGGTVSRPANRFRGTMLEQVPVPLPRAYVQGIDLQRVGLEGGWPVQHSYLRGQWSEQGWWYYYLYALAIKVPLGTWCLAILTLGYRFVKQNPTEGSRTRDELFLLAPAVVILLIASSSTVTDHLRYILPCFPLAFIWISKIATASFSANPWFVRLATLATAWTIGSCLWIGPHYLSYFNEVVGGPADAHFHLVSSNLEYGQDLLHLKQWYDKHPEARPLGITYNFIWPVDPQVAGIDYFVAPSGPPPDHSIAAGSDAEDWGPRPGWYAANVNAIRSDAWPARRTYPELSYYGYFLNFQPVDRVGYSILIYHLTLEQVNQVRMQMGLPLIEPRSQELQ